MKKLSARAEKALGVLKNGGWFRYGLESGWHGEKFEWSLKAMGGLKVKGVGGAAYKELVAAGFAFESKASGFTGIATNYTLKGGA